jgi:hypothetical protein
MKKYLLILLYLLLFLLKTQAQTTTAQIENLLLEQQAIEKGTAVVWKASERQLQIGQYLIPVSDNTHLQIDRNANGRIVVAFLLQKGTAVTDRTDPNFRRAYWAIPFQSRRAGKHFIALFQQL